MEIIKKIEEKVKYCYWEKDYNCAITSIKVLSELFNIKIGEEILNSAIGIPGAGRYGAQCGLVNGALMIIGLRGKEKSLENKDIRELCNKFSKEFDEKFKSLLCSELRPQGFNENNPPHLCEPITNESILLAYEIISGT
ncbi:C-GCAxxG-C-C family protein [Haliovirga abyssi]|uniref:C_GCAxxG_C_C family protein n=1 Tax=Haliovirga abyssi TaxID=2996794 RepID=A0AAU9DTE4_9FUSO|nr:C-GCAxxG-C-C family protein [Haliovirga abyssi]BDU50424.1 hypothetical protein HLVA_09930 [Haliovirga abyssi]